MPDSTSLNTDPLLRKVLLGRYLAKRIVSATVETVTYEAVDQTTGAALRIVRPVRASNAPLDPSRLRAANDALVRLRGVPGLVLPAAAGMLDSSVFLVLPALGKGAVIVGAATATDGQCGVSATVQAWLKQISDTLDTVHGRGLCHGRLSPEAVVRLEDGRIALDGLPLALMGRTIGQPAPNASTPSSSWTRYAAPEIIAGGPPSSAADQYALARMVADSLGFSPAVAGSSANGSAGVGASLPPALARALSVNPQDRFAGCGQFFGSLIAAADSHAGAASPGMTEMPPLEMAPVLGRDDERATRGRALPADAPLELGDSFTAPRQKADHRVSDFRSEDEDDLLDITFTKPGEDLLAERSKLSKAASFGASRGTWRRMARDFQQLSGSRKGIAGVLAGIGVIILAFVLLSIVWRVGVGVTNLARSAWETATTTIKPDLGSLKQTGEQVFAKAKDIFAEWRPKDSGDAAPAGEDSQPPARVQSQKLDGEPWPDRPEDQFSEEELTAPISLIDEITGAADDPMSDDGSGVLRGVFTVDTPDNPGEFTWIGGFGVRPKGKKLDSSDRPFLDGLVLRHIDSGTTFVGSYSLGVMKQFWLTSEDDGRRRTVAAKVDLVAGEARLNGGAFVLDEEAPECLALVYDAGSLVGGQWCKPVKKEDAEPAAEDPAALPEQVSFEVPTDIVKPDRLAALDPGFEKAVKALDAAAAQLPEWNQQALDALKKQYSKGIRESKRKR